MSSIVRSLTGKDLPKLYKYASVIFPQKLFLSKLNLSYISPSACGTTSTSFSRRIRFYTTQRPAEHYDVSQGGQASNSLNKDFFYIDSVLKRHALLKGNFIKKLADKVKHSAAGGVHITPQQSLFLLQCCGTSNSRENAQTNIAMVTDIWNMYQEQGLSLDISHYNTLLEIFLENEHKFSPVEFLSTLEEKNIQPNQITYSRLLARYCQDGDIEGATKILQLMKDKGLPVTEYVFNFLIMGNSKAKDLEGARNILEIMTKNDCPPSSKTYETLLEAYAENGDFERMKQLLAKCEEEEIPVSYRSLLGLVCALATNHHQEGYLREMMISAIRKAEFDKSALHATLLRLFDTGHDRVAYEVLSTFQPKGQTYQLSIIPREVASSCNDLSRVVALCEELTNRGLNVIAFELALESYLLEKKFDFALGLLRQMKERQIPLKEHYFYPLICYHGSMFGREKVFELFEEMVQMGLKFSEEFFSNFFLPKINCSDEVSDLERIYLRLLSHRSVGVDRMYCGIVAYLLEKRNIKAAAEFVNKFPRGIRHSLGRLLSNTFIEVGDVDSTVCVLRQLIPFAVRMKTDQPVVDGDYSGIRDFLFNAIRGLRRIGDFEARLIRLLSRMETEGVGFPPTLLDPLVDHIGDYMTEEIQHLLDRLSDPSLILAEERFYPARRNVSIEELRRKVEEAEQMGESNPDLKIDLLCGLIREGNVQEVEQLLASLKAENVSMPPPVLVRLLDLYLDGDKLQESQEVFHQILSDYPDFRMHAHKILKYAILLVREDKFQDAARSLQMASPENGDWTHDTQPQPEQGTYRQRVTSILGAIVAKKDVTSLQLIQEVLLSRKFAPPSVVLPPLVKYYLDEDNLEEAFSTFIKLSSEYEITVYSQEMLKACIVKENKDKLQQIMEINSKIHGEMNSWFTLAFALIEMEKLGQAEKIFRTPGLRALHSRLNGYCKYLIGTGKISQLELLIKATKELFGADRPKLFEYLLEGMISFEDPQRALGVWLSMQEENVIPTDHFLITLANFLRAKDMEVPFVVPKMPAQEAFQRPWRTPLRVGLPVKEGLIKALDEQDLSRIQSAWSRMKESEKEIPVTLHSRVIGSFLKFHLLDEALAETKSLLNKDMFPHQNVMKLLLSELSSVPDVASIEFLEKYINEDMKRKVMYHYYMGVSHINAGRTEEYLNTILRNLESSESVPEDIATLGITPGFMRKIVLEQEQHFPLLERCAETLNEKGNARIFGELWSIYFILGNLEKAEEIYEKYLTNENTLPTRAVCESSRFDKDTQKLDDVLKVLDRKEKGRELTKGRIFSTYIDILNSQEKFQEALKVVEQSLKSIKLEHYQIRPLQFMENQFRKHGLTFPYNLSLSREKEGSSSSSSSSSSDE